MVVLVESWETLRRTWGRRRSLWGRIVRSVFGLGTQLCERDSRVVQGKATLVEMQGTLLLVDVRVANEGLFLVGACAVVFIRGGI